MSHINAFASAKSAALAHLAAAAEQLQALQAATASSSSPQHTGELREASNALRAKLGEAAEALRYLDQCARRPCVDPVRAAMLRGDVEALRPALLEEVFEAVEREKADGEADMLLSDVWPAWTREHGAEGAELPPTLLDGCTWMRLRDRWLPLVGETLRSIVDLHTFGIETDRARLAKCSRLAAAQLGGEAGVVVDEAGTMWSYTPGEIEESIALSELFVANATARLVALEAK